MNVCGSITIYFSATGTSKESVESDFCFELFREGAVMLMNVDNETLEMEVHEYELDVEK